MDTLATARVDVPWIYLFRHTALIFGLELLALVAFFELKALLCGHLLLDLSRQQQLSCRANARRFEHRCGRYPCCPFLEDHKTLRYLRLVPQGAFSSKPR